MATEEKLSDLFDAIQELLLDAGRPSSRAIATAIRKKQGVGVISHNTVNEVVHCKRLPKWDYLEIVVDHLGGDPERFKELWKAAAKVEAQDERDHQDRLVRARADARKNADQIIEDAEAGAGAIIAAAESAAQRIIDEGHAEVGRTRSYLEELREEAARVAGEIDDLIVRRTHIQDEVAAAKAEQQLLEQRGAPAADERRVAQLEARKQSAMADLSRLRLPGVEQAVIVRWLKALGEFVRAGEPLAELSTDDGDLMDLTAKTSGLLIAREREGHAVAVGAVLALIWTPKVASAYEGVATTYVRVRPHAKPSAEDVRAGPSRVGSRLSDPPADSVQDREDPCSDDDDDYWTRPLQVETG